MEANHLLGKSLNTGISSLPDEILIYIFSYLKLVHKRACRIVSKRWKSCCEARTITETEKFVFRSPIYQNFEINEFLVNIQRSRINVEFNSVDLAALNFEKFGGKIKVLHIKNYFFQDESILKNVFITTPNMTCLSIIWSADDFYNSLSKFKIISKKVIGLLQEENFQNTNLKQFHYYDGTGRSSEPLPMEYHQFTISHLFSIFPCIECFSSGYNVCLVDAELRNVLPKTNITRLLDSCVLRNLGQWESFAYLSKLEILYLSFWDSHVSVNLCKKLLSQVTGVKILSVRTDREGELGKMLFLEILTSCLKLEELTFNSGKEVCLNTRDEIKLVCTSILKLRKVTLETLIRLKSDSEKPDLVASDVEDFLEEMYIEYEMCGPLDLHHMLLNTCRQLTILYLNTEVEAFYSNHFTNITKILQTQRYLKSLTIQVRSIRNEGSQVDLNRDILSKHENLEYLRIGVWFENVCQCFRVIMEWLPTWEFPSLQSLDLSAYDYDYPNDYLQSASDELRKLYSEFFTKMSTLTGICLRWNSLKFEDCEKMCSQMRGLETIRWTEDPGEPQKIVNLFVKFPNLRLLELYDLPVEHEATSEILMYEYFYSRSDKKLFKYRRSFLENGVFGEWYLSKQDTDKKFFEDWCVLELGTLKKST